MPESVFPLKKMGSLFDALSTPAGQCTCCPDEPGYGEWYYEPATPGVIKQKQPGDVINIHQLEDGDILKNEASGLSYRYDETAGMVPTTFIWPNRTYIILGEISGAITVPENCTLIFQGGKFTGSLTGNYSTIEAGPVQIFDVGLELSGTFTNECAYPEWWGAKATRTRHYSTDPVLPDCSPAIQKAFDSPFYKIEFATGFYLLNSTIYLQKRKHIKMQGFGVSNLWDRTVKDLALGTVLWTRTTITALEVNLGMEILSGNELKKHDQHAGLIWDGGCIDVSFYGRNNVNELNLLDDAAIRYCPRAEECTKFHIALRGPMYYYSTNQHPAATDLTRFGIGIHITNGNDHTEKESGMTLSDFDVDIFGFSTGILVDYERYYKENENDVEVYQGALTSISVHGLLTRCFKYIDAPSGGFAGGVIDCSIQTTLNNKHLINNEPIYLLDGDFHGCYIDSMIWDYPYNYALHTTNAENLRLGPRMLAIMSNSLYSMMMSTNTLAGLMGNVDGQHNATVGNYDLCALATNNVRILGHNYVHLIDNDFLSIDKIVPNININITQENLTGFCIVNKSPFDRQGLKVIFTDHTNSNDAYASEDERTQFANKRMTISIDFPYNTTFYPRSLCTSLLALHLKGRGLPHFSNLRCVITSSELHSVNGQSVRVDTDTEIYNDDYASAWNGDIRQDIVLPFLFNYQQSKVYLSKIVLYFEGLAPCTDYYTWSNNSSFCLFIEGRLNRHYYNNLITSSGGDIGGHLMKWGKPYIMGTEADYTTFADLPSTAADGAMAVLGSYPVINTPKGWMIQQLSGTTSELNALPTTLGSVTVGQSAFNTTVGKPVWWNGAVWVDATGYSI